MLRTFSTSAIIGSLAAGALLAFPAVANASENYPSVIQSALDMPCAPGCLLCHTTVIGRADTVRNTPGSFIFELKSAYFQTQPSAPLGGKNEAGLRAALAVGGNIDADADGTKDLDELQQGGDPNSRADGRICGPSYGCGARISEVPASGTGALLVACGAALLALGLRRRR